LTTTVCKNTSLERIIGCDPEQTYLGGGYLQDICSFKKVTFARDPWNVESSLEFDYSFLKNKQGFHLSAVNIQFLVPFLCEKLADVYLNQQGEKITSFDLLHTEQKYQSYITSDDISFQIALEKATTDQLAFSYKIHTLSRENAFEGTMRFKTIVNPTEVLYSPYPSSFENIRCQEGYTLENITFGDQCIHAEIHKKQTNLHSPDQNYDELFLTPARTHAAVAQLTRILFCQSYQLKRNEIMDARAIKVIHTYTPLDKKLDYLPITVSTTKKIKKFKNEGNEWGLTNIDFYSKPYVEGKLLIACPIPVEK